jgi:hypothetical protein
MFLVEMKASARLIPPMSAFVFTPSPVVGMKAMINGTGL